MQRLFLPFALASRAVVTATIPIPASPLTYKRFYYLDATRTCNG